MDREAPDHDQDVRAQGAEDRGAQRRRDREAEAGDAQRGEPHREPDDPHRDREQRPAERDEAGRRLPRQRRHRDPEQQAEHHHGQEAAARVLRVEGVHRLVERVRGDEVQQRLAEAALLAGLLDVLGRGPAVLGDQLLALLGREALSRLDRVHEAEADPDADGREGDRDQQAAPAGAAQLAEVAHLGDAQHDRRDDERDDHHEDEAEEQAPQRLGDALHRPPQPGRRAEGDVGDEPRRRAEHEPAEDLGGEGPAQRVERRHLRFICQARLGVSCLPRAPCFSLSSTPPL